MHGNDLNVAYPAWKRQSQTGFRLILEGIRLILRYRVLAGGSWFPVFTIHLFLVVVAGSYFILKPSTL